MLVDLIRLARPQQWIKNGVVLAAVVFAGSIKDSGKVELAFAAAGIFCLLSSAVYAFNDLMDRRQDQAHPLKKDRPLASGRMGSATAVLFIVILLAVGLTSAWAINRSFFLVSLGFLALNVAYSLALKHLVIFDAMTLGLSFVVRAYAGAAAIQVPASKWMLINTLLLALFLSFGKRRHELVLLEDDAQSHRKSLSHYSPYLLDQLIGVTTASVVVMYMLYSFSPEVSQKLGTENLYLTIPFVVYGVFRYLYLIHRRSEGGSPTRVIFTDRPLLATVLLWLATAIVILYHV